MGEEVPSVPCHPYLCKNLQTSQDEGESERELHISIKILSDV